MEKLKTEDEKQNKFSEKLVAFAFNRKGHLQSTIQTKGDKVCFKLKIC